VNFVSSITLAFKDSFSAGFSDAKDSLAGMKGALDDIGANQSMNRLVADMEMMNTMTDLMRKALSDATDRPSRIAGSMDSSFRNIQISLGATNQEMETTRRELLAIGGRAVGGPQAVASAFADVASGVADASKHMAVMNAAVLLSEANQSDLASATGALVNVMNAWNLSADNAGLAADILTQTALMGVGSMDEFAGAIGNISALAANAGIGLDELGASFAYATNKGLSAGQVQKQLKGIITTLASPSEDLAKLYNSLGFESGQAMLAEYGLADSLAMLRDAVGDDAAFSDMIGSLDAATVALALTEDAYVDFATSFGDGMLGVSEAARGVQLESIEMKMARLDAASASLQAQIGQDINGIKGFFVDMKFGFLSNVVSPIMTSPLGGALSKVAAGTGMLVKGVLDAGSGAMTAATQMTTLAANISNAGGIAKMFKHGMGLAGASVRMIATPLRVAGSGLAGMGRSIIGALPSIGGYISSMWASVPATLAATWPILAIIAGVALLAAGVYLLIKNWDVVGPFFAGMWEKVKGFFSAAWDWIKGIIFGASDWILVAVSFFMPFIGLPMLIIKHWDAIKEFFVNLWNDPKETILGFIDWVGEKVAALIAPFKAVGDVVGGVFEKVGGFFKGIFGGAKDSGAALNDAFAGGIESNAGAPGAAFGTSLQGVGNQMPHSDAPEGPLSTLTASGRALTETFASGMDSGDLREKAELVFGAAMPAGDVPAFAPGDSGTPAAASGAQTVHIENLYLQAEDCETALDFVRQLMQFAARPQGAPA